MRSHSSYARVYPLSTYKYTYVGACITKASTQTHLLLLLLLLYVSCLLTCLSYMRVFALTLWLFVQQQDDCIKKQAACYTCADLASDMGRCCYSVFPYFLFLCFFVSLFFCFFFCATAAPSVNTRHVGSRATHVANIKMHSLSGNATQRIWWTCSDKCGAKCTFTCWAPASALQMHHCQLLLKKMHTHTYTHSERKKIVLAHSTAMVSVVCERICNKMFYLQHDAFALLIHTYNH